MKKFAAILLSLVLTLTVALADSIYVVSREDGSGTRAAFIELTGVEQKEAKQGVAVLLKGENIDIAGDI